MGSLREYLLGEQFEGGGSDDDEKPGKSDIGTGDNSQILSKALQKLLDETRIKLNTLDELDTIMHSLIHHLN